MTAISTNNASDLQFTGTLFNFDSSSNFLPSVSVGGVFADQVTIVSDTEIVAQWTLGIPVLSGDETPVLVFEYSAEGIVHRAGVSATISNPLTITSHSSGLSCSFAGGCLFHIEAAGLSAAVQKNSLENSVTICDAPCNFSSQSDASNFYCEMAPLSTVYSN